MFRKEKIVGFGLLALLLLSIALATTLTANHVQTNYNQNYQEKQPWTAYIEHRVEKGEVITISANWTYKVLANGKLVKDPFAATSYFDLASFTIYPATFPGQGFVIGTLTYTENGETVVYNCDLYNALGRSYSTTYITDTTTGTLQRVVTNVSFVAPCDGNVFVPQRIIDYDWKGSTTSSKYRYSLIIPEKFTKDTPYRVSLVDNGVHEFTSSEVGIDPSSYLFLLRGFFKGGINPTITLILDDNTQYTPSVTWDQQRVDYTHAKIVIKIVSTSTNPINVKEIKVTFNNITYGRIIFTTPVTLLLADYIKLEITINA